MTVAKGRIDENHNYVYTCGFCNGKGLLREIRYCPHCYNLHLPRLMQEFETARGERYYALLKAILSIKGKAIYDRAKEVDNLRLTNEGGHLTYADLYHLFVEFEFPRNRFKPFMEWLEESGVVPSGTHQRMVAGGLKVGDCLKRLGY